MTDTSESQLLSTRLILPVSDVYDTMEWYERVLGLEVRYVHGSKVKGEGDVANFATMARDEVELHFILDEGGPVWTKAGTGNLNLIVRDVETVFSEVKATGAAIAHEVQVQNWGARAFKLKDPSGNEILIEQSIG